MLPNNEEAEKAILGALLFNNILYEKIGYLQPECFFNPTHQEIYKVIVSMIFKGMLATPITIAPIFKDNVVIEEAGGSKYWVDLVNSIGPVANIDANAKHVYDLFLRRSVINLKSESIEKANEFESDKNAQDLIESLEVSLFNLALNSGDERKIKSFQESLQDVVANVKLASKNSALVGVLSGIDKLDQHLGGFHKSDLIILAGRPAMGKTALATTFAFNAAKKYAKDKTGAKVAFFSLEMSSEQYHKDYWDKNLKFHLIEFEKEL